jgi:RNA-directed DNA polymerase
VRSIDSWCRDNRHIKISEQQQKLNEKLRGHYAYCSGPHFLDHEDR